MELEAASREANSITGISGVNLFSNKQAPDAANNPPPAPKAGEGARGSGV